MAKSILQVPCKLQAAFRQNNIPPFPLNQVITQIFGKNPQLMTDRARCIYLALLQLLERKDAWIRLQSLQSSQVKSQMEASFKSEYRWCNGLNREMSFYLNRKTVHFSLDQTGHIAMDLRFHCQTVSTSADDPPRYYSECSLRRKFAQHAIDTNCLTEQFSCSKMAHPDTLDGPALLILSIAKTRMGDIPCLPALSFRQHCKRRSARVSRAPLGASDQLTCAPNRRVRLQQRRSIVGA